VEGVFSEVRESSCLGRWDEKADPLGTQYPAGLQIFDGLSLKAQWKEDRPMSDGSRYQLKMTAGLDLGDKYSHLCLLWTLKVAR
jgi:hypothetical protein